MDSKIMLPKIFLMSNIKNNESSSSALTANKKSFKDDLIEELNRLSSEEDKLQFISALYAVGYWMAHADGELCDDEKSQLSDFFEHTHIPDDIKKKIECYEEKPPCTKEIINEIKGIKQPNWELFIKAAKLVADANGELSKNEKKLINKLKKRKKWSFI